MMNTSVRLAVLAIGLVVLSAAASLAAPNVLLGHDNSFGSVTPNPNSLAAFNQFVGSLSSYGVDDIEDQNPVLSFGATGITGSAAGTVAYFNGGFGLDFSSLIEIDSLPADLGGSAEPVNTVFNFSQPVTAFGLYVVQGGDMDSTPPIEPNHNNNPTTFILRDTVNNLEDSVVVQIGPDWGFFNSLFVGIKNRDFAFNQVELVETGDFADGMLYDNVVVGFVPEPSSVALMLLGGVGALAGRSRGRRS
jgi:hypothetical protein